MRDLLNTKLLSQPFKTNADADGKLETSKLVARMYMQFEHGLSVLSDMKARRSYIFYGALAGQLGLEQQDTEINSIWEDELLNRVHPDDLQKKYKLELQFFKLLNTIDIAERVDYGVITKLRVRNKDDQYILLTHRLIYISSSEDGSMWLALCLYNIIYDHPGFGTPDGVIVNTRLGKVIDNNHDTLADLLSLREKEILQLIKHGHRSKEIADKLSLSINTVNRHRQNIFQKLGVTNALEACRIAENIGLLK